MTKPSTRPINKPTPKNIFYMATTKSKLASSFLKTTSFRFNQIHQQVAKQIICLTFFGFLPLRALPKTKGNCPPYHETLRFLHVARELLGCTSLSICKIINFPLGRGPRSIYSDVLLFCVVNFL